MINNEQLQHLDTINEEQAVPDELQPKILSILGKIEANTSALLRQSVTLPASHRTVSTRTAQINNYQAPNQYKIDTQSVSNKHQIDIRQSSSAASKSDPVNVSVVNAKVANKSERTVTVQEKQTPSVTLPGTQAGGSHSVALTLPTATVAPSKPQKRTSPEPENITTNSAQDNTNKQVLPRHVKSNKPKSKSDQQQAPDRDSTAPNKVTPKEQPSPILPRGVPEQNSSSDTPSSSQQAQNAQREQREQKSFLDRIGSAFQAVTSKSEEMANDESEGKAKDAAGSAIGGSLWDAALEVKELADDVSNSSIGQKVIGKVKPPKDKEDEDGDQRDPVDTHVRGKDGRFLSREERQKRVSETASRNEPVTLDSQISEQSNATANTEPKHAPSAIISATHQEEAVASSHKQSESHISSSDKDETRSTKTHHDHEQSNTNQVSKEYQLNTSDVATDKARHSQSEQVAIGSKSEHSSVSDQHQDVQSAKSSSISEETAGAKEAVASSRKQSESHITSSDKDETRSTKTHHDHEQSNTNQVSKEYQLNTSDAATDKAHHSQSEQVAIGSKSEHSSVSDQYQDVKSIESKNSSNQSDIKEILNQYQPNTTNKQITPELKASSNESAQAGSALVAMERDKDKQTDSITDRLDEQVLATNKNHKELVKTIKQKSFGGSEESSMADSLFDMLGGESNSDKKGPRKGPKGSSKRSRIGRMVDKVKSKIPVPDFISKQGGKFSKVSEGVKNAISTTKSTISNSAIGNTVKAGGKIAGGALKSVGSVASKAAAPIAALTAGYFKYDEIKNRDDLTGGQKAIQVGATTAGSMGGASAGMMAGAAMGSVVPVVGTIIGGLLGAALGGWLGSKGGDIVGEAITDQMKGTDGFTKAARENIQTSATEKTASIPTIVTTSSSIKESNNSDVKQQEIKNHAVQEVSAEQLKVTLPEIPKSQQQINPINKPQPIKEITGTEIDYKKMGKVFEDALNKTQQSNVAASASSGHYGGSNRTQQSSSNQQINTEFDDKTLVLMAHDRI